jgi:death-on-curing protein
MSQDQSILYLTYDAVAVIHLVVLDRSYGNQNISDYIRYQEGLFSALAQPQQHVFGKELYPTLFAKAAAYMFFITKNHSFIDGNKRTALLAGLIFLEKNGVYVELQKYDGYNLITKIARNQADIPKTAEFLESRQPSLTPSLEI